MKRRRIANLPRPPQGGGGLRQGDPGLKFELMRCVVNRKRPQKMGSSRMDHGCTSDVHDHANAALSNPILLWRGRKREGLADTLCSTEGSQMGRGKLPTSVRVQSQNRKVRAETLSELETSCADPVDQHLSDVTLAAQGEHRGVTREVVDHQQEVTLVTLATDAGGAPHVHVKSLQRSLYRRKLGGVRGGALLPLDAGNAGRGRPRREGREGPGETRDKDTGGHASETRQGGVTKAVVPKESLVGQETTRGLALATTGATPLRRAATSSTAAAAASATSAASAPTATAAASSASTAATDTSTPATIPTTTPTPSIASTATSTAPASPSSVLAPLALAGAASLARGRRSSDRLEANEVGRSSRSNRGQEGGGGTPLKDGGTRVTTRGSYNNYALLYCQEALLEEVNGADRGGDGAARGGDGAAKGGDVAAARAATGPLGAVTGPRRAATGPRGAATQPIGAATGPLGAATGPQRGREGPRRAPTRPLGAATGPRRGREGPRREATGPLGAATRP
ncbi:unnamed protein product [Closterium sp. NIES-64]|nr:unnamed protein product [Closterium sp. NIES-64]